EQLPLQRSAANDEVIRDMEEEVRFDDGSVLHLLAYSAPLRDGEKRIRGAVGAFIDITTRKQAEIERHLIERKMLETQKLESLGVLAGGIAHDFNNLLTGVVGNASLARMQIDAASPLAENLDQIQQVAMQAGDLCRQLLAYAGKGRYVIELVDLSHLVRESEYLLQSSVSKSAVLAYELAEQLPRVKADASQLRQIIMNLVINASEALEGRSGVIRIHTGRILADRNYLDRTMGAPELPVGDYVFLEVGDNGCGIPADHLGRIFEPFFTTKFTGRGLGLAAVLGIIRGHQGAVKVYSEVGQGTTFKILLPVSTRTAEESHAEAEDVVGWRGTGLALVVDDDESVRAIAVKMMSFLGFEVLQARNGAEALGLFQQHQDRIALVLLDLTMPMMDGEEAFRRIRAIRPEARVLLMSGFNEQEAVQRFLGRGLAGFLQKPFTTELLREKLRLVLA
ncbi:MAG TPA: response regulator, partial [Candidatus Limnocylindria bacterium]|nr:response regulator [Candidatus Limnocylindria bacterium]